MLNYLKSPVFRYEDISIKFRWATKKADFNEEIGLSILWLSELDGSGHWEERLIMHTKNPRYPIISFKVSRQLCQ
jgi:hypothetical protein